MIDTEKLLTRQEALAWLREHGLTAIDVAKQLNVPVGKVRNVLYGASTRFRYGDAHTVAVALGMKAKPKSSPPPLIPPRIVPISAREVAP